MMKSFGNVIGRLIIFFLRGENNNKGVIVLVKQLLKIDFENVNTKPTGKHCFAEIKINDKTLVIGNINAPTKDKPVFFYSLFFSNCKFLQC